MNWTKTSAVAETLSSVAILITLVYLVVEIQQNAEATQAETRQAMLDSDQQFLLNIMNNPELDTFWYKPELTDEEKVRLSVALITFVRMRENNWLQYQNGVLDERTWEAYRGSIVGNLSTPQSRIWWSNFPVEVVFDSEFISLVDELIANVPVVDRSSHLAAFD